VRGPTGRCRNLVLLEHDVLAVGDLEALDDLLVRDLAVLGRAEAPMLDLPLVRQVHLAEAHGLGLDRRVQLHGHVDHADGDRSVPE
jgi:hypothetical protein